MRLKHILSLRMYWIFRVHDYHDMLLSGVVNITIHVNYRIGGEDKEEYYTFYDVGTTTIDNN